MKHIIICLALLLASGSVWAQGDQPYVIKRTNYNGDGGEHYLAHVREGENYVLQDATSFSPECIWYSGRDFNVMGTHHNYYFIDDDGELRYLSAPLQAGGTLTLSDSQPPVYLLNNTDQNYYFYDWDQEQGNRPYGGGLARGHQYNGVSGQTECQACTGGQWNADDGECWAVYWVEYDGSSWKLSSSSQYNITVNSGRFRRVTVTSYPLQVSGEGGLSNLQNFDMEFSSPAHNLSASITPFSYIPAYKKYEFDEVTVPGATPTTVHHTYYYPYGASNTSAPANTVSSGSDQSQWTFAWSISGEGAEYLSFTENGDFTHTSSSASPTLYYRTENVTGHKTATLTLTVTYQDGSTQTSSCTVTVKTPCQNPQVSANVSYEKVVISWTPTAQSYTVSWKVHEGPGEWVNHNVTTTSYTITGLANSTEYDYKVKASCTPATSDPTPSSFTTFDAPDAIICGSVFGGGRMANVTGKTEVVIINADSIGAVYGGNDIAGEVQGADGSTVVLGVNAGDSYSIAYNNNQASTKVRVLDVYGGGNGYYVYDDHSPSPAIGTIELPDGNFSSSVTDVGGGSSYTTSGTIPKIKKTSITMTSDVVKVDSIFGGAKNAFITNADANTNGTSITVKGGTAFAVYGGNNYGGAQTDGKQYVKVEGTKTNTTTYPAGFGRNFGIAYLFGGGNKVAGKTTEVEITGGMCDTVFGGGNAADVTAANVTMNCVGSSKTYTNAVSSWSGDNINEINGSYPWDGTGIYNVRTLFGGNNRANMAGLPIITLTSGSVGTVYGGGNAGDMLAQTAEDGSKPLATDFDPPMVGSDEQPIYYGTHVVMDHANMIVDYLYGGCQMSDVEYSTWVEIKNGHVGTVYGGCNVSGDVGSEPRIAYSYCDTPEKYQLVKGGTYVKATGGTVYGDLFAGSNGYYHCNDGVNYIAGHDYSSYNYVGKKIPSHNETHVMVSGTATVKSNVYAGGNMAYVGFINETDQGYRFRDFVGFCAVRMDGGTVEGSVYGGGNRASVFGSNEVKVSGGSIGYDAEDNFTGGALYGGNDRAGQVAQITNRVFPSANNYDVASDGHTNLDLIGVKTYVGLTGKPKVYTVYGGGNGAYDDYETGPYCDPTDKPVQSNTFVDINIDAYGGSGTGGYINTVYGGGNGVTVLDRITVLVNVQNAAANYDQIGTIFGGNNQGDLGILSDIILLHGQVNTIYGGCNSGAMTGSNTYEGYTGVGSVVQLRNEYRPNGTGAAVTPDAKVTGAVYGGCRMNNVSNNSLVLVEGGNHSTADFFGGCDISGIVGGTSQVVVTGGQTGNIYGGGNGNYDYSSGDYASLQAPRCMNSRVDIIGGQVGADGSYNKRNIFGGGWGQLTSTTGNVEVNIGDASHSPTIYGVVYGGSALGSVNTNGTNTTTVNILNGNLNGSIYGGGLGQKNGVNNATSDIAATVNGKVYVNIGATDGASYTGNATITGDVYGCNNLNGSPKDDVFVNIYKTAHGADAAHNLYPSTPGGGWNVATLATNALTQAYAINAVYGGGNLAAYQPEEAGKESTVHVYACDNTVKYVFGGGNAADVGTLDSDPDEDGNQMIRTNTNIFIEGGRFHQVIGGGNGEGGTPANIWGTANTTVYAGLIDEVYGGANKTGDIDAINLTMSNPGNSSLSSCTDQVYGKVFGCANAAHYNRSVTTNVLCGVGTIGELYGGSNQAFIGTDGQNNAHVTLNLYGGNYQKVFAGSKGVVDDPSTPLVNEEVAANIYGDVTLNLYGGTVVDAFGGSDVNGNIAGIITVNVIDIENTSCPLHVDTIFGASNRTPYEPYNLPAGGKPVSPVVNVVHVKEGTSYVGNVFGGGNLAAVTANPQVNIGYDGSMTLPTGYTVPDAPRAYVTHNVFGGGNLAAVTGKATVNLRHADSHVSNIFGGGNSAGITSTEVNIAGGEVAVDVYGGCNTIGTVTDDIAVNLLGGTVGQDVFGGGKGNATATSGNILVTVDGGTVTRDVYGGSALGQVNNEAADLTKVWLKSGTVGGNLYGGGMGEAGESTHGQVNGQVEVLVAGGTVTGSVFGCNNTNGQPTSTVKVTIDEDPATTSPISISGNVFGGGNVAYYDRIPIVEIKNGTVSGKIFGGGNNIATDSKGVLGSNVQMTGGTVLGGIYGGCNTDGDVMGDSRVTITGGTIGADGTPASIHGGGYGDNTTVHDAVTVTFGTSSSTASQQPMLYGALYGGSALGSVNTDATKTTTVNVLNGTIKGYVYGGGMGLANVVDGSGNTTTDNSTKGQVNGDVHVNIGSLSGGQANLRECNVFGCNNTNGSPQKDVYVDIYQTGHTLSDLASNFDVENDFAILQVFGGGNRANYTTPGDHSTIQGSRTHVYVHGCENTISAIYGGGNAADAIGVQVIVEGGRFGEIYGGGNGREKDANVGAGGSGLNVAAGNVHFIFKGSNKGGQVDAYYDAPAATSPCPGGLFVDSYFFGANEAEIYGDLDNTISCSEAGNFEYRYVYAGSRWGIVYGDIKLTVQGGTIENLFGGCKGEIGETNYVADVRKFPTFAEINADYTTHTGDDTISRKYSYALRKYMGFDPSSYNPDDPTAGQPSYADHGGNITLIVNGGTMGNVIGGCDLLGNVEGKIMVTISEIESTNCPLFVGNVYGGCNKAPQNPNVVDTRTPEVRIINGTIGGTNVNLPVNNVSGAAPTNYAGNVFGGGNLGDVTSNPLVIVGDGTKNGTSKVTVKGDVYGGGNEGDVNGDTKVVVEPNTHTLAITTPGNGNLLRVTDSKGNTVNNGASIGEDIVLNVVALPSVTQRFTVWEVTGTGSIVGYTDMANTSFTMGSADARIEANFEECSNIKTLTINTPTGGSIKVTDVQGHDVNTGASIGEGTVLYIVANPDETHKFSSWTATGTGSSVGKASEAVTTFIMGSAAATLSVSFTSVTTHQLTYSATNGTVAITNAQGGSVASSPATIGEGSVLNIEATPASDSYAFVNWTVSGSESSVANANSPSTTFTMGKADASLTANFATKQTLTVTPPVNGNIKVTSLLAHEEESGSAVGAGAKLNLKATPVAGYAFKSWTVTGTGASVAAANAPITTMIMGTDATTVAAEFVTAHVVTINKPDHGSIRVNNSLDYTVNDGDYVGEDAVISLKAVPEEGYTFSGWTVTGATPAANTAETTLTMGTGNVTITATFTHN